MKRLLFTFFILISCSYPSHSAFHDLFNDDLESKKKVLKILSDKYHALAKWYGYKRYGEERMPYEHDLTNRARTLAYAYSEWLGELNSKCPDLGRINDLKLKIQIAREGKKLPEKHKELSVTELWKQTEEPRGYKVLKAYIKSIRPKMTWPGKIYDPQILKILYESKSAKYLLMSTISGISERESQEYKQTSRSFEKLAIEERDRYEAALKRTSPLVKSKSSDDAKGAVIELESKVPFQFDRSPQPLKSVSLNRPREDDDPICLLKAETGTAPSKKMPTKRQLNLTYEDEDSDSFNEVRLKLLCDSQELAEPSDPSIMQRESVKRPRPNTWTDDPLEFTLSTLTKDQEATYTYLVNECGMTEAEAIATILSEL